MRSRSSMPRIITLAVESLAAFAVCVALCGATRAAVVPDDKTRSRAQRALREGEFALAEKMFRELLSKDAHDNGARLGLSLALLKQRNLQDAYDHAARVILADPLSSRAHALLGAAVLASGDFHNSVEEFRTALRMDVGEALAVAGLAMIDFYENRLELAIKGLRRAVSLDPNEPDYVFSLGQAAGRSERYKEAADAYERFLFVAPKTDEDRRARIRGLIGFLRYLGRQGSLYVPAGANRTSVQFETTDGRPIIRVRVNGEKSPLRFVLDTGSGMSVVSEETARRLGLRPIGRGGLARAVGGGGRFEIVYGFISSIEIGESRIENVPVYIRHFYDDKSPVDGYLGLSVIAKFLTSIDYGERMFTLARQTQSDNPDRWATLYRANIDSAKEAGETVGVEIPLRTTSSGFLSGEVRLEGVDKPQNFIIDTGASTSVVSEELAARDGMTSYVQPSRMRVFGAAGVTEDVRILILPRIVLGAFAMEKISVAVLDLDPVNETAGFTQDGILGGNFLKHFRIFFDFQRGVIRLADLNKTPKGADGPAPEKM